MLDMADLKIFLRGAALSKLPQVTVISSVAERHYGVAANSIWDESRDKGREKLWDKYEGVWRAKLMTWFINKVNVSSFFQVPETHKT